MRSKVFLALACTLSVLRSYGQVNAYTKGASTVEQLMQILSNNDLGEKVSLLSQNSLNNLDSTERSEFINSLQKNHTFSISNAVSLCIVRVDQKIQLKTFFALHGSDSLGYSWSIERVCGCPVDNFTIVEIPPNSHETNFIVLSQLFKKNNTSIGFFRADTLDVCTKWLRDRFISGQITEMTVISQDIYLSTIAFTLKIAKENNANWVVASVFPALSKENLILELCKN